MLEMTMAGLERLFGSQFAQESNFVGIAFELPGQTEPEVIINQKESFEAKLSYYKNTYNEDLTHKHAQGVKIVNFTFGNTYQDIHDELFGGE